MWLSNSPGALLPKSIAAKLYCASGLAIVTLIVLSLGAVLHVRHAERTVGRITDFAVKSSGVAADVEILLAQHRRLIETAPFDPDPSHAESDRRQSERLIEEISRLIAASNDPKLAAIAGDTGELAALSGGVLDHVARSSGDMAIGAVIAYARLANRIQDVVRIHRQENLVAAHGAVAGLIEKGKKVTTWYISAAMVALFLIAPLSLVIIRDVARRINGITVSMRRIAHNDTAVTVPSIRDHDEIGEMARALEVFKRNAVTLLSNSKEIERLNTWFAIALNNMARGLSMFDADKRLIVCNRHYLELYGIPESLAQPGTRLETLAGHWARLSVDHTPTDVGQCQQWLRTLDNKLGAGEPFSERHHLPDGRTILVHIEPLEDGGWVDLHEDVTEKQVAEARITQLARYDTLTGLANRHTFLEELDVALARVDHGQTFALIWIDLDKFKEVNDTLGHPVGDALLRAVAKRISGTLRQNDVFARLGGDEFAIIEQGNLVGDVEAAALSKRLIALLSSPFEILGHTIQVGASIGIALAPQHGTIADNLLKNADIALYRAKTAGRGTYVFYSSEFEQKLRARRQLETDLRHALANGHLKLHYQPIISLSEKKVVACEALMRWRHPERGMISPAEFIPLAEEIGLIGQIGEWALAEACREAAGWFPNIKVAVNLSASQFEDTDLVAVTSAALAASGLTASRLELEVTETLLIREEGRTLTTLRELRDLGVSIALDDFGTGYASLSYLKTYPFNKIKIDQSFVRDLPSRGDCVAIVSAVVDLAKTLGMRTVAEGVETAEHLAQVSAAGCDEVQGYYFSRPAPAREIVGIVDGCKRRFDKAA